MTELPSKRLRLRFFPEDEKALEHAQKLTSHGSKSNVIRAALVLYESIWSSRLGGFSVLFCRGEAPAEDVLAVALSETGAVEGSGKKGARTRSRTEKSMEIRITPADEQRIEALRAMQAAGTSSEVVRRAVRLYAAVVARCRDGWDIVAVSPSGDMLPLTVPGLKTSVRRAEAPADVARPILAARDTAPRVMQLSDLLPSSLAGLVAQLVTRESCPIEALLVDMLRTEASVRLGLTEGASSEPFVPEPAQESAAVPTSENNKDMREALEALAKAMDQMAENIDGVAQSSGDPAARGKQAPFTDMLFGAVTAMGDESVPQEEAVSEETWSLSNLLLRAQRLNERLVALADLIQQRMAAKATKPARSAHKPEKKPEEVQQTLFGDAEEGSREGWGLVLARDENGAPQQRIIESETVIPLGHDDLHR